MADDLASFDASQMSPARAAQRNPAISHTQSTPRPHKRTRRPAVAHHRGELYDPHPHPDSPDPANLEEVRRWVKGAQGNGLTAVDIFAGGGGLSLGLHDAGFTVLVGADNDRHAARTHAGNIAGLTYDGDLGDEDGLDTFLSRLDEWGIGRVDLVAGGPPCQPFSRAGTSKIRSLVRDGARHVQDSRAQLWRSFMAVVRHLRPRAVLIENVPDLPSWDDGAVLIGFYEELRAEDYQVDARVLDAFRHGVPQHRARLFIVAIEGRREFEWPHPQGDPPTLGDAIGDLPPVGPAHRQESTKYRGGRRWDDGHVGEPPSRLAQRLRRDMLKSDRDFVWDHITRDIRPDDAVAFRELPQGGTYLDIPEELRRYRSDIFTDKYKRLSWREVSRTITAHIAKDGYWYIHPDQHRTLSIREAARVQTFPDWFRFAGQPTHRLRQIGNAVPPLLGEAIGLQLAIALTMPRSRRRSARDLVFRRDLINWHAQHARRFPWRESGMSLDAHAIPVDAHAPVVVQEFPQTGAVSSRGGEDPGVSVKDVYVQSDRSDPLPLFGQISQFAVAERDRHISLHLPTLNGVKPWGRPEGVAVPQLPITQLALRPKWREVENIREIEEIVEPPEVGVHDKHRGEVVWAMKW
jgi:DNA (cytosine-5)-methyltransferase 1